MVNIITGTAFDATERMHHREDEVALEFPSSVSSRRRGLLALKAQNWRVVKKSGPTARDYVQDGLAIMWDGIENAGWGVHDDNARYWYDLARPDGGGTACDRLRYTDQNSTWASDGLELPAGDIVRIVGSDGTEYLASAFNKATYIPNYTIEQGFSIPMLQRGFTSFSFNRTNNYGFQASDPWSNALRMAKNGKVRSSYDPKNDRSLIDMRAYVGQSNRFFVTDVNSESSGELWLNGEVRAPEANLPMDNAYLWNYYPMISGSPDDVKILYIRVYNRTLSVDEIRHNFEIDQARFGLA